MKIILSLFSLFALLTLTLHAQEYNAPIDPKLEKAEDYAKYEPDVIKCIEYLEKTPISSSNERRDANAFLFKWISGSPTVTIDLRPYLMGLVKENKDFLMIFMGGWTKFAIQNPDVKDKMKGHLAGLQAIVRVYIQNPGIRKDEAVEAIVKAEKNGALEDWLKDHFDDK